MQIDYKAPPTIARFMQSDARRRVLMGPFGSGKSSGAIIEVARRCAMQKVGPDGFRRSRWAIIRNTLPQLRDTTLKSWLDWFPNGSIGYWKETGKTFFIETGDIRAEILFRALDDEADVKNLLSLELTGAWFNESREIIQAIVEGVDGRIGRYPSVRNGGSAWFGIIADTNPPDEETYWYHIIEGNDPATGFPLPPDVKAWEGYKQPSGLSPEAENVEHLEPGYYENLAKGKPDEYVKVYIRGEYGTAKSGKPVFAMFNPRLHVADHVLVPNKKLKLVIGYDAGLTPAALLMQLDSHGRLLILDEVYDFDMGAKRFIAQKLNPVLRNKYDGFDIVVSADPAVTGRAQTDEKSVADIFRQARIKIKPAYSNNQVDRQGAVETYLSRLTEMGPGFLTSPNCKHFIRAMKGGYHYKINKAGVAAAEPNKNEYSHIAEAGEYGAMYFERDSDRMARERRAAGQIANDPRAGVYSMRRY